MPRPGRPAGTAPPQPTCSRTAASQDVPPSWPPSRSRASASEPGSAKTRTPGARRRARRPSSRCHPSARSARAIPDSSGDSRASNSAPSRTTPAAPAATQPAATLGPIPPRTQTGAPLRPAPPARARTKTPLRPIRRPRCRRRSARSTPAAIARRDLGSRRRFTQDQPASRVDRPHGRLKLARHIRTDGTQTTSSPATRRRQATALADTPRVGSVPNGAPVSREIRRRRFDRIARCREPKSTIPRADARQAAATTPIPRDLQGAMPGFGAGFC